MMVYDAGVLDDDDFTKQLKAISLTHFSSLATVTEFTFGSASNKPHVSTITVTPWANAEFLAEPSIGEKHLTDTLSTLTPAAQADFRYQAVI
jgi:hypothetical protein